MKVQPVVVVSPLAWLLITFWKPLLAAFVIFVALLYLMLPIATSMGLESARRYEASVPTMYIAPVWRDALTQGALRDAWSAGRETREHWRVVEQPYVSASALEDLEPGTAHLRVPSVDGRRTRVEHVRVAMPALVGRGHKAGSPGSPPVATQWRTVPDSGLPATEVPEDEATVQAVKDEDDLSDETPGEVVEEVLAEGEDLADEDFDRIMRRLEEEGEADGECRLWPEAGCNDQGYPKVRLGVRGENRRMVTVHKWLWERENGAVPKGWSVEHKCHTRAKARGECKGGKTCKHRRCCELEHLEAMPHGENTLRRDGPSGVQVQAFAVALFAGYNQTAVQAQTLTLEDLVVMLNTFVEVKDKRQARCWSPTAYSAGQSTRHNDGVEAVSALVFDMDKVPPDPDRLAGVCWIAHTTWSHRPETPKWRVVLPLAEPVPASRWTEVWRRARAALCPEADPSCKDPSRQYYVPSHGPGVASEASHHAGPLLDVYTLPALPPDQPWPE